VREDGHLETHEPSGLERLAVVLGFVLLLACGALVAVSGLIMPVYGVAVVALLWIGAVAVAMRGRNRPALVLMTPFAYLAVWLAVAWLGEALLDWTA